MNESLIKEDKEVENHDSSMIECSDVEMKKFKIKNTKGKVVYDQATK